MLFLFTALSVLALFKFRKRPGWKQSRWVNFGYPLIPLVYVSMNAWVFVYFARLRGWEALWSLLTVAGGAVSYSLYFRRRKTEVSNRFRLLCAAKREFCFRFLSSGPALKWKRCPGA
jgi:amino acid transporter